MKDILIFAIGTLFGMLLLIGISAIFIQFLIHKDAVKEDWCYEDIGIYDSLYNNDHNYNISSHKGWQWSQRPRLSLYYMWVVVSCFLVDVCIVSANLSHKKG